MRKTLLLSLFFILIGYTNLPAQDSAFATIPPGRTAKEVLTVADIYLYTQFTDGKIVFMDGSKALAKMNYNRLFDQVLFINDTGDTLALADEKIIKYIVIGDDTFYYNKGYIRLIADDGIVKLAERQVWVLADIRKIGTHNRPMTTVAVTSYSTLTDGAARAKSQELIMNENVVLKKETQYYFGDKYNYFVRTGKKNLLQLFGREQQKIEDYLKENKVNFDKRDDLEKLTEFIAKHN